jgi:hypothetical protein
MRAIKPEVVKPGKPTILVSGPPKTWKSRLALQFPQPYYIDTESGVTQPHYMQDLINSGGVYLGQAQGSQNFGTIIDEVKWLQTNKHDYKTLVLDSLSNICNIGFDTEEARMIDLNQKIEFAANRKPTMRQVRRFFSLLKNLDMTKIIICHQKDKWIDDGDSRRRDGTTFDGWDKLEYLLDLWGESRRVGKESVMTIRASRYKQFPIGTEVPMHYKDFVKFYGENIIEKAAVPIVPSTPEQADEIKRKIFMLKMDEKDVNKWLTTNNAEEIEDLPKTGADAFLTFLDEKIKGVLK